MSSAIKTSLLAGFIPKPEERVPAQRFVEYADSLDPLIAELQANVEDRRFELAQTREPYFFLDFSELHYLWVGRKSTHAWLGKIDPQSALIDAVVRHGSVSIYLPPGTVFEIATFLARDLGQAPIIPPESLAAVADPTQGVSQLTSVSDILKHLPSYDQLLQGLRTAIRQRHIASYGALEQLISEKKLVLFHETEEARASSWDQSVYDSALSILRQRPKSKAIANFWDAVNVVVCSQVPHRRTYLIARSKTLANASRVALGRAVGHSQRSSDDAGMVRSPAYLYLYANIIRTTSPSASTVMKAGALVADLSQVRLALSLIPGALYQVSPTQEPIAVTRAMLAAPTVRELAETLTRFRDTHRQLGEPLYTAWESFRSVLVESGQPIAAFTEMASDVLDRSSKMRVAQAMLESAEGAKQFLKRLIEANQVDIAPVGAITSMETADSRVSVRLVHAALSMPQSDAPFLFLEFVDDYVSAWWRSKLTIHGFLDWVDRFVCALTPYAETTGIPQRARGDEIDWTCCVFYEEVSEYGDSEDPEVDAPSWDHRIECSVPLSFEDRAKIIRITDGAQAVRMDTPFGDVWFNMMYGEGGGLRTGIMTHYPVAAFLAAFVSKTNLTPIPVKECYDRISELMGKHLGSQVGA